jgi:nitrite reductase (NADH) large subunit
VDVGAVAIGDGKWEIYVGGANGVDGNRGARRRKAHLLCVADSDEVALLAGRFMDYYRDNARCEEPTAAFVERLGIERIRATVFEAPRIDGAYTMPPLVHS